MTLVCRHSRSLCMKVCLMFLSHQLSWFSKVNNMRSKRDKTTNTALSNETQPANTIVIVPYAQYTMGFIYLQSLRDDLLMANGKAIWFVSRFKANAHRAGWYWWVKCIKMILRTCCVFVRNGFWENGMNTWRVISRWTCHAVNLCKWGFSTMLYASMCGFNTQCCCVGIYVDLFRILLYIALAGCYVFGAKCKSERIRKQRNTFAVCR